MFIRLDRAGTPGMHLNLMETCRVPANLPQNKANDLEISAVRIEGPEILSGRRVFIRRDCVVKPGVDGERRGRTGQLRVLAGNIGPDWGQAVPNRVVIRRPAFARLNAIAGCGLRRYPVPSDK